MDIVTALLCSGTGQLRGFVRQHKSVRSFQLPNEHHACAVVSRPTTLLALPRRASARCRRSLLAGCVTSAARAAILQALSDECLAVATGYRRALRV
jgi:hypothetical protein